MVILIHEDTLLQEINRLDLKGKIQDSAAFSNQVDGSKLTSQNAKLKINQLIPSTRQRLNAAKFYLDLIEHIDFDDYLRIQVLSPSEPEELLPSKVFIDFSDHDTVDIKIELLKNNYTTFREASALIVFIVLSGFFSNLVSLEDCVAQFINIVYDLVPDNELYSGSKIGERLKDKIPKGKLTHHFRSFIAIKRKKQQKIVKDRRDKKGCPFNIAKEIRNQLTHNEIENVLVSSSKIPLSGSQLNSRLSFQSLFFPDSTNPADTEITIFCNRVFDNTVDFIDECYSLIHRKLRSSGKLPV